MLPGPLRAIGPQQAHPQLQRLRHPDATVAEGAPWPVEQLPRGGIVQVDGVLVGEQELDPSEGVVGPRALAQYIGEVARSQGRPVHRCRVHQPALRGEQVHLPAAQVAQRVRQQPRQDLPDGDAARDGPGGVDLHQLDQVVEHRGLVIGTTHLDGTGPFAAVVEHETGQVDGVEILRQAVIEPAYPFQVDADLVDAALQGDVELGQGQGSHEPVRLQQMEPLEGLHRLFQVRIEALRLCAAQGLVAQLGQQALPQHCHPRGTIARVQGGAGRNPRPAALLAHRAVAGQGPTQLPVDAPGGDPCGEQFPEFARAQGGQDLPGVRHLAGVEDVIPLPEQAGGIHLAGAQVDPQQQHGIGQQQLPLNLLLREGGCGAGDAAQGIAMVVGGFQPLGGGVLYPVHQRLAADGVVP